MELTIKILLLEDVAHDAHLISAVLANTGLVTWVNSKKEFDIHLSSQWDIVLIDHTIPGWSGMEAVNMVRARSPKCPCVLISGVKDDLFAAEAIRGGAQDF